MDVFAGGKHSRVANGITPGAGLGVFAIECFDQCAEFVVLDDLVEAEFEVFEDRDEFQAISCTEW